MEMLLNVIKDANDDCKNKDPIFVKKLEGIKEIANLSKVGIKLANDEETTV